MKPNTSPKKRKSHRTLSTNRAPSSSSIKQSISPSSLHSIHPLLTSIPKHPSKSSRSHRTSKPRVKKASSLPPASSTPAGGSTVKSPRPRVLTTGSIDALSLSLYLTWPQGDGAAEIHQQIRTLTNRATHPNLGEVVGSVGDQEIICRARGLQLGKRGGYLQHHWTIAGSDLYLSDRIYPHATRPALFSPFPDRLVWKWELIKLFKKYSCCSATSSSLSTRSLVSRVDFALDITGISIESFLLAQQQKRLVTRARRSTIRPIISEVPTLYFGQGPMRCRIYDKVAESSGQSANAKYKRELLVQRRWHNTLPSQAVRIEFSLGSQALRPRGLRVFDDLVNRAGDVVRSLTFDWLRFTAAPSTRGNSTRTRSAFLWRLVQWGFSRWGGDPSGEPVKPVLKTPAPIEDLRRQIRACRHSVAHREGGNVTSPLDLRIFLLEEIGLIQQHFGQAMLDKIAALGAEERREWKARCRSKAKPQSDAPKSVPLPNKPLVIKKALPGISSILKSKKKGGFAKKLPATPPSTPRGVRKRRPSIKKQ